MIQWQIFCEHLENNGFDQKDFHSLLKFIDAPENPIELPRIVENLLQLLPALNILIMQYSAFDISIPLSKWEAICRELKYTPELQQRLTDTNKKGKMPLRGYYDSNPIYVAVWQCPESVSDKKSYFMLFAHVLLIVTILRDRMAEQAHLNISEEEHADYKGNITNSLLLVRNLSHNENNSTIAKLKELNISPSEFHEFLEKSNDEFAPLRVILTYLLGIKKRPHRKEHAEQDLSEKEIKPSPRNHLPATKSEIQSNLEPEQDEGIGIIDLLHLPAVEESESQRAEKVGCSPRESVSGLEIVSQRVKRKDNKEVKSPAQKVQVKRKIKTQLAMLNQRLTYRWEVLSLFEVSTLLTAIASLITEKEKSPYLPKNTNPLELAAILATMFWYGVRVDNTLQNLKIYTRMPHSGDTVAGFVTIINKGCFWWTKPAVPDRKILPAGEQLKQVYHVASNFAILSGIGIEQIIDTYFKKVPRGRTMKLFPRVVKDYEDMTNDFFSLVNDKHATRLTANRTSDFIFDAISRQEGSDLTTAMFTLGREHFLARNQSYYTTLSIEHLQNLFRDVCRGIRDRHLSETPRENQKKIDVPFIRQIDPEQPTHVGSPFRPTQETVANLAKKLKSSLVEVDKSGSSVWKLMRLHNNMSRYTAFLVAFSTGFRAIRDPFLSAAEIDWVTGFAVLSDKDNEDKYNSRLIWLPPQCLLQLKYFREHQLNTMYRFNALIPGLQSMLDRPRREGPGRHMFFSKFDNVRGEYVAFTPGPVLFGSSLKATYALPFNSSRHYLRSNLIERKCPIEIINALLGHYERGEEPSGRFSGLSPLALRDAVKEHLVPILKDDGWEALPGLGAQL